MAWLRQSLVLVALGCLSLLLQIQTSLSLTCSSQKFTKNRLYSHCNDLPHLSSYLHWTYNSNKSSLSLAFIAPPASSSGWIAWAINPNQTGMVGSQALIAFKEVSGSMTVKTYNLVSYKLINQTEIAYDVSDMEAEYESGEMRIFATLALPENTQALNQVWQVGSRVVDGKPSIHGFQPDNLNSKGKLDLIKGQSDTSSGGNSRLRNKNVSINSNPVIHFSLILLHTNEFSTGVWGLKSSSALLDLRFKGYIQVEIERNKKKRLNTSSQLLTALVDRENLWKYFNIHLIFCFLSVWFLLHRMDCSFSSA